MKKHISLRIFVIITLFLIVFSIISGVSVAIKYSDFEQKNITNNTNYNISYTNIEKTPLEEYIKFIKNDFSNNLELKMPTKIKMQYNKERTDEYLELFISNGYLIKYDSITGNKKEYVNLGNKIKNIIYNEQNKYLGILKEDSTYFLSRYNEEEMDFEEFFKVDSTINSFTIINNELYIVDTLNELHKIKYMNNTWTIEPNDIFNDGTPFKKYEIGKYQLKIKFDGTLNISDIIIKNEQNNPIFANKILFDCTSIDRNEYEILIIDYKGALYKKNLDATFDEENNAFEFIGELKGINYEKKNDLISKINFLFTNDDKKTFTAATNYQIYSIYE